MKRRDGIFDSRPFRDPNLSQGLEPFTPEFLCTRKRNCTLFTVLMVAYSETTGMVLLLVYFVRRIFINFFYYKAHISGIRELM